MTNKSGKVVHLLGLEVDILRYDAALLPTLFGVYSKHELKS
jgi:hypothetical protein